jgi:hypothetical protein
MKLAAVYFDDTVCIPGGKDVGGGASRQDLRESTFSAADGWSIHLRAQPARGDGPVAVYFELWREGMPAPAFVGGYGFTFIAGAQGGPQQPLVRPAEAALTTAPPAAVPDAGTTPKRRRK